MSKDPFKLDKDRRDQLSAVVFSVRLELWEASESNDAPAALAALKRMYKVLEQIPDAQILYVGESPDSFALPPACRQMTARYGGQCIECDSRISRGDMFYWEPHDRAMICVACGGIPGITREQ